MDGIGTSVTLTRGSDGRLIYQVRDADCVKIGDAAYVEGSVDFKMGVTQNNDITQFMFKGLGEDIDNEVILQNTDGNHYDLLGEDLNVTAVGGNANLTIQVDGTNNSVDLSNTGGSQYVWMSEESSNNSVKLGYGNDNYVDYGKFNHVKDNGGNNRFETGGTAHGSVIVAGAGNDQITIGGDYGIIDAGDGVNNINTIGFWGQQDSSQTANRNIIMSGSGDDTIEDHGGFNIFFAGGGTNKFTAAGVSAIAQIGAGSIGEGVFKNNASDTYVFKGDELTNKGTTYNIYDVMADSDYSWGSLYEYLQDYSEVSENDLRSLYNQNVIDAETMGKLKEWFGTNVGASKITKSQINQALS